MATFNQHNQTVGVQHNAENMMVGTPVSMADLTAGLNDILGQAQRMEPPLPPEVRAELEAARDAAASGDNAEAQGRLRQLLEVGSLTTGIDSQVATMLGALLGG
ncbi:hypothetical protein QIS99_20540 [Streptomyces sp. B-S-A8]|uniref:Uncharacterized protein n=1 Tax=Streptomyces solicavernae TaxID=3043614 RepID=A0ABT6RW64_9ACTN|nr:hypothetical protein [Streptomyces sp. B-S-A8]MDI3388575.1 hypothetical protein [Streptomyces sp. B-S-A8]